MSEAIHRRAGWRFASWKNGGGETAEILCVPQGAGYDDFAWRISSARVERSGPFSSFSGVSRTMAVLDGGPMTLTFDGAPSVCLDAKSAPYAFSGARRCVADLHGPTLINLNVMVRAPYVCHVLEEGAAIPAVQGVAARYLFARRDLPDAGLSRHDLLELGTRDKATSDIVPAGTLLIVIRAKGERA